MSQELSRKSQIISTLGNKEVIGRLNSLFQNNEDKADKFRATLINIALDSSLANLDPMSIIKAGIQLAEIDLPLAKSMGQAYIVKYGKEVQAVISYKGWLALAKRSGVLVKSVPVFKCDDVEYWENGFDTHFKLVPSDLRDEGDPKWVKDQLLYIVIITRDLDTRIDTVQKVSLSKIKQIVKMSKSAGSAFSPYTNWIMEMYQAKAIKYVLSKTAMSETIGRAVEIENSYEKPISIPRPTSSIVADITEPEPAEPKPEEININIETGEVLDDE